MYPIPANATRIRYLESTGTQYVDTGYILNTASKIEVSGKWTYRATGAYDAQQMGIIKDTDSGQYRTAFGNQSSSFPVFAADANPSTPNYGLPNVTYYVDFPSLVAKVNTAQAAISSSYLTGTFTRPFYLFARCESGTTPGLFCKFQLKSARFWTNGVLVRDFVPVRVGQVGYLFDRVSGQLFGNAGMGNFTIGPDTFQQGVVPTRMMAMGVRKKNVWPTPLHTGVSLVGSSVQNNNGILSGFSATFGSRRFTALQASSRNSERIAATTIRYKEPST